MSLVINGLSKIFNHDLLKKKQIALDSLNCEFPGGRCTGLLGHNGAGKTTTIRIILGLIRPDAGSVTFEGAPITLAVRRRLGYMPEINKLNGSLTPAEVLDFHLGLMNPEGARTRQERRTTVGRLLEEVGLKGHAKKRIGKLSKGMARRVAWALAVSHKPHLLILDEPSSGLDPLGRRDMMRWIQGEKERGTTIVLCTHELSQVKMLCDELHLLRAGKLVLTSMPAKNGGVTLVGKATRHVVHVAGGDEAAFVQLRDRAKLTPWSDFMRDGFLSIVSLESHADAMRWVQELTAAGFLVVRFGDEAFAPDEAFFPFFDQKG